MMDVGASYEKWKPMVEDMHDRWAAGITAHAIEQEISRFRNADHTDPCVTAEVKMAAAVLRRVCAQLLCDSAVDRLARVGRDLPKQTYPYAEVHNRVSVEVFMLCEIDALDTGFMDDQNEWSAALAKRLTGYIAEVT